MKSRVVRFCAVQFIAFAMAACTLASSQSKPHTPNEAGPSATTPATDYSGMYSFLRDGEFVQLTVEDNENVTGFVSRYSDSEGDQGTFLDHFFKSGQLDGHQLAFATEAVGGVSFEFHGTIERGEGKHRGDEAYYVLKGSLVENTTSAAKKTSSASREVTLKGFPKNMSPPQAEKP